MKKILLHILFVAIVFADLLGEFLHNPQIDRFAKPLLLIWIAGYFFFTCKKY